MSWFWLSLLLAPWHFLELLCPLRERLQFLQKLTFSQNTIWHTMGPGLLEGTYDLMYGPYFRIRCREHGR
jgi:hypothetical protein